MTAEQLKASILKLAIEGKLVEQRPEEGTAHELYEKIQQEREKLISEGKLKKEKSLPEISEEEFLFEIPQSWKWTKLGMLVSKDIKRGKSPKYVQDSNILVFAQKCNSKYDGIKLDLAKCLDAQLIDKYPKEEFMVDKDIIINSTGGGTMGRVGFYSSELNTCNKLVVPDTHVTIIRTVENINSNYIFYYLKYSQKDLEKLGEGSTNQTELKANVIQGFLVPIPPLEEQKRIVAKIEELFKIIDFKLNI